MCKTTAEGSRERALREAGRTLLDLSALGSSPLPCIHGLCPAFIYRLCGDPASRGHGGQSTDASPGIPVPPWGRQCCSAVIRPSGTVPLLPALSSLVFWRVMETWGHPGLLKCLVLTLYYILLSALADSCLFLKTCSDVPAWADVISSISPHPVATGCCDSSVSSLSEGRPGLVNAL